MEIKKNLMKKKKNYERYVIREAIECTAARLYNGNFIRSNKNELMDYASKIDSLKVDSLLRVKEDITLHASLVNLAGISSLTREFLRASRIGTFYMMHQVTFNKNTTLMSHVELIENLVTDDPDKAEKIIREHIWSNKLATYKQYLFPDHKIV